MVVGLLCLTSPKETLFGGDGQLPDAFVLPILKIVLPWLSGAFSLGSVFHRICFPHSSFTYFIFYIFVTN